MKQKSILRIIGVLIIVIGLVLLGSCPKSTEAADPATLKIINNSLYTVHDFYCTESNVDWGTDLLSGSISPGGTQDFNIPAGTFDMDAEETTNKVYWDSYDEIFVSGAAYEWILTNANATEYPSIIGTWENTILIEDAIGAGLDIKAGATMVYALGTYSTTYTVIDTNNGDTEYNCSHSGTILPTDPDSAQTLVATVAISDGAGSDYYPLAETELQFIYSNLTATTVVQGTDMNGDDIVDFFMSLVRQ